jgi:hypothetical protein
MKIPDHIYDKINLSLFNYTYDDLYYSNNKYEVSDFIQNVKIVNDTFILELNNFNIDYIDLLNLMYYTDYIITKIYYTNIKNIEKSYDFDYIFFEKIVKYKIKLKNLKFKFEKKSEVKKKLYKLNRLNIC